MDALYLLSGAGTPSNSRPWSKTEANLILGRVDRASLSPAALRLYDTIAGEIAPGLRFSLKDGFGFGARLNLNLEAYYHSNSAFDQEADWVYGFVDRKPIAKLSLDFSLKNFLYLYCDMQYERNRFSIADNLYYATSVYPQGIGAIIAPSDTLALLAANSSIFSQTFLTNIFSDPRDFDYQWPKRAVASIGGANWNFAFSRDKVSWGNGHSGNFIVDDHSDYQEFARLVAFSDIFKYDWLNIFLDANPTVGELPDTKFKLLMAHRLEFRVLDRVTFAVSEDVMYENSVFDARYLNPAFIYHNLNNRSIFNAIAHAELDVAVARGFNLYAQFVMDQARAPTESSAQADAKGYLGGIEYAAAASEGIFTTSLEMAFTDPLLYRRELVDFMTFRKYYTNGNPTGPGYILDLDYLGYQYGGDAIVLQWDGAYHVPGRGEVGLRLFGMLHGAMNFFVSHNAGGNNADLANYEGATPSGDIISETIIATVSGNYALEPLFPWMEFGLWAELDWVNRRNYTKSTSSYSAWASDLQLSAGCSLTL